MVWFFERGSQEVAFEIRRTPTAYEMALRGPGEAVEVEYVESAADLLARVTRLPQTLLQDGWRPRYAGSLHHEPMNL